MCRELHLPLRCRQHDYSALHSCMEPRVQLYNPKACSNAVVHPQRIGLFCAAALTSADIHAEIL
jgi:hypothetical protein